MLSVRRRWLRRRYQLLAAILALFFFFSFFWLPQRDCGSAGQPCSFQRQIDSGPGPGLDSGPGLGSGPGRGSGPGAPLVPEDPVVRVCPGQVFQVEVLLLTLKSSLLEDQDVLLDQYLLGWDQLISFMESLGSVLSFFSVKVKEKVQLIRQLSIKQQPAAGGGASGPYHSVGSMVGAELRMGVVGFQRRTDSGCRTLLRLHRSLLWLKLLLEGLCEDADANGRLRTPGELSREAYQVALAPHHSWFLRQAAELVFLSLPDRHHFLQLVCVREQREATPILRLIIHALTLVHQRTQSILDQHGMLALP